MWTPVIIIGGLVACGATGFAVAPLVRIGIEGLGHLRVHVQDVVGFTKLLECLMRHDKLDIQIGEADGEIELDKGIVWLAADTDVPRHLIEGAARWIHVRKLPCCHAGVQSNMSASVAVAIWNNFLSH